MSNEIQGSYSTTITVCWIAGSFADVGRVEHGFFQAEDKCVLSSRIGWFTDLQQRLSLRLPPRPASDLRLAHPTAWARLVHGDPDGGSTCKGNATGTMLHGLQGLVRCVRGWMSYYEIWMLSMKVMWCMSSRGLGIYNICPSELTLWPCLECHVGVMDILVHFLSGYIAV